MIPILLASSMIGTLPRQQLIFHPRTIHVWVSRNVAPSSKVQLTINTENLPMVNVTVLPIDGIKWLKKPITLARPQTISHPVAHYQVTVKQRGQNYTRNDNFYSRQVNLPKLPPGVYLLNLAAGGAEAWSVVDVTNFAVIIKRSPINTLCWITNFKNGQPVQGAQIDFFSPTGKLFKKTYTRKDGTAFFATPPNNDVVVIKKGNDLAGVETGAENPDGRLKCLFQTDRPIYRPGQTIDFKAILRLTKGQIYQDLRNKPVDVELRDPRDNPLDQVHLSSNSIGTVAGHFFIPQEGLPGPYTLVLKVDNQHAYQTLTVAAYRKPEFKVVAKSEKPYYLSGQDIQFKINADYYFGASVPQAKVSWIVRRMDRPMQFGSQDQSWFYGGDGNLYPRDTYNIQPYEGEGTTATDATGHATITIHTARKTPNSVYSLQATLTDSDHRQVAVTGEAKLYAAKILIGIENLRDLVQLGGLVPMRIHVKTIAGKPTSATVHLSAYVFKYNSVQQRDRKVLIASKIVHVPSNGEISVAMPALDGGEELFVAKGKDQDGRTAYASSEIWVYGGNGYFYQRTIQPTLAVKLDRKVYKPGQVVHCYVQTNTPNKPILMVLQGGDIWNYKVVYPHQSEAMTTFPTGTKESPNAFVEACQWTKVGLLSSNAITPLPDQSRLIHIQLIPNQKTYEPGDKAQFTVETTNPSGKGVPAEVALGIVDESIYALSPDITPDPFGFYWGLRQDRVATFQSAPQDLSGGAYQNSQSSAPVRQKFKDTAYWNPFVETNAEGQAIVSLTLPGNLTQWRATARAITGRTHVGVGKIDVTATRPLTVRIATPRLMAVGDRIALISTINNLTKKKLEIYTRISLHGITLQGPSYQTIWLNPKSEGTVRWNIVAKSEPKSGFCTITARASAIPLDNFPGVADAVRETVPIVPRGVVRTDSEGGTLLKSINKKLSLPQDALTPGSTVNVKIFAGFQSEFNTWANQIISGSRFGTYWAVNALKCATAIHLNPSAENVKEAFALLSRDQNPDGWGWWDGAPTEADITAEVGNALALAKNAGYPVYDNELKFVASACESAYAQSNLWDEKARLAATLLELHDHRGPEFANEVIAKGQRISPFAQLRLAIALHPTNPTEGKKLLLKILPLVSNGSSRAYLPVGYGVGWNSSSTQSTAEMLRALHIYQLRSQLQSRLALWLALPSPDVYRTSNDVATVVDALSEYSKTHPDAKQVGASTIKINGSTYGLKKSTVSQSSGLIVRDFLLHGGENSIQLTRTGGGEAFYILSWRYYRPLLQESTQGLRVIRRFEVRNKAGVWKELNGPIKADQPVRCTVVVWGDSIADAIRVSEPLPAGFEFVSSSDNSNAYEAVLDGKVVHYLANDGTPDYFRYYLRPEAEGHLIALPATAEFVRRPEINGRSNAVPITVTP